MTGCQGDDLSTLANRYLLDVPDAAWRSEQLVDAITSHFEHYLSWIVSALTELVNERLEASESDLRLAPQLGPCIRYGVDTSEALSLMVAGIRSRRLAHAVAQAAAQEGITDSIRQWLGAMSLPDWRDKFSATATEVLDLLDLTRVRRRSTLRTLLETGVADVTVMLEGAAADRAVTGVPVSDSQPADAADNIPAVTSCVLGEVRSDPTPRRLGVYDADGKLLAVVPANAHNDVQAVVDTGLVTAVALQPGEQPPAIRITLVAAQEDDRA